MKKYVVTGVLIVIGVLAYFTYRNYYSAVPSPLVSPTEQAVRLQSDAEIPLSTVIATDLDTPWSIVFLPDNSLLVTERPGQVVKVTSDRQKKVIARLDKVREIGEGGLLGMTLHPDFVTNHLIYFYYTYSSNGNDTKNRVVRMSYEDSKLQNEQIIVDAIPGASNHNGGRIAFGPDGFLYITTGDAQEPSQAQDTHSLAGKILRVTDDGKPAPGNPFQNEVYSYGHRNPQGIIWDSLGRLFATEHGRSGVQSGLDEVNLILKGSNYGWPDIQGEETKSGMIAPIVQSGTFTTWAPAGIISLDGKLMFAGLRGSSLYLFDPQDSQKKVSEYLKNDFGRLRDIVIGPDNMIYITTSNKDGRGIPKNGDDKIIKINPMKLF